MSVYYLPKLISLTVTHSNLKEFPDITSCQSLEFIDFSFNNIKSLPSMVTHKNLKSLELVKNDFASFKNLEFQLPDSLFSLNLRFNAVNMQRGYRLYIAHKLPNIQILDAEPVIREEMVCKYSIIKRKKLTKISKL